jgi:hypothetical protein
MGLLSLTMLVWTAGQQPVAGPPYPPPEIGERPECGTGHQPDEIVVCGETTDSSRYRIPQELRERRRTHNDTHASWDARIRDQESLERFSNQNDGPFGIYRRSREIDCQWRVARQELRGERPDCGTGLPF